MKTPKIYRTYQYYFHKVFPRHMDNTQVAYSVAVGVFIGLLPTIGVALILTVAFTTWAKLPRLPGVLSSFIAIPPTLFLFFYPLGYALGLWIVPTPPLGYDFLAEVQRADWFNIKEVASFLWYSGRWHVIAFLVGIIIVATFFATLSFFISIRIMQGKKTKILENRLLKQLKKKEKKQPMRTLC